MGYCRKQVEVLLLNPFFKLKLMIAILVILQYVVHFDTNDYWWHIRMGEWIVQHEGIPFYAIGNWYANLADIPWFAHEWLSEVILYGLTTFFGVQLLRGFFCCLTIGLLFFLVNYNQKIIESHYVFSTVYLMIGAMVLPSFIYGRPQTFLYILLLLFIDALYGCYHGNMKKIYFMPLLSILWVNLHGGSANLIYILPGLIFLGQFFPLEKFGLQKRFSKVRMEPKKICILFIATVVSTFVQILNPHLLDIFSYPYINVSDSDLLKFIIEWMPASLANPAHIVLVFLPLFFCLGVFILTMKKIDFVDFLLFGSFFLLSLRSIRFSAMFFIVSCFYIYKYLPESKYLNEKITVKRQGCFVLFCICLLGMGSWGLTQKGMSGYIVPEISKQMENEISSAAPQRLYNDYDLGAELIYFRVPVFIDGRADAYVKYQLADALALSNLERNPEKIIEKYDFDYMVIHKNLVLYWYLLNDPARYALVFEDDKIAFFRINK